MHKSEELIQGNGEEALGEKDTITGVARGHYFRAREHNNNQAKILYGLQSTYVVRNTYTRQKLQQLLISTC